MKKEVDYLAQYEIEQAERQAYMQSRMEPTAEEREKSDNAIAKLIQLGNLKASQFKLVKSEELMRFWVDGVFEVISRTAEIKSGRAVLSIDEDTLVGKITYWGHEILCSDSWGKDLLYYARMLTRASEVVVSQEEGLIRVDVIFHVYDQIKIADKSEEIRAIRNELRSNNSSGLEDMGTCE